MNLAGQLVINKARFGQIGEQLKDVSSRKQSSQCLQNISSGFSRMLTDASELAGNSPESDTIVQGIQSCVQQVQRDLEVIQSDMAKVVPD